MAFLWKHPQTKYWQARFYDKDGKRRNRSTRILANERNRKKAQRIADQFEEAASKRRTSRHVRRVISELHEEITGDQVASISVRAFIEKWLQRKSTATAESTQAFYRTATNKFLRFLADKADEDLSEVTRDHITEFRDHEARRLAPTTANHHLKCVRMIFKDAVRDDLISDNPAEFVESVRSNRTTEKRAFTVSELKLILEAADGEWRSMVLFGLYTGQRLGDIARLTRSNLDLSAKEVRLITSKTNRVQKIPICEPLLAEIKTLEYLDDPNAPLHPRAFETVNRQGKTGGLSNQFNDLLASVGLREKVSHRKSLSSKSRVRNLSPLSFHSLRRTATTLLHEAGVPAAVAQELIGHDSEQIHQIYVRVGREALSNAVESFPDLTK